jgi:hypothetical protein
MRIALRAGLALALVGTGYTIAKAQAPQPVFELQVDAPAGETTIRCLRGCGLLWVERGINPRAMPTSTFEFGCNGATTVRCASGRVGGWLQ